MNRIYLLIGLALGALIAWSFGHEARRVYRQKLTTDRRLEPMRRERRLRWAQHKAITGEDLSDPAHWEKEFAKLEKRLQKRRGEEK